MGAMKNYLIGVTDLYSDLYDGRCPVSDFDGFVLDCLDEGSHISKEFPFITAGFLTGIFDKEVCDQNVVEDRIGQYLDRNEKALFLEQVSKKALFLLNNAKFDDTGYLHKLALKGGAYANGYC